MDSVSRVHGYITPDPTPQKPRPQGISQTSQQNLVQGYFKDQGQKRWRKIHGQNLRAAINRPTIRRLARRGGVKRIKSEIYGTVQTIIENRLREIMGPAIALVEQKRQKTLTALDVVYALRLIGNPIYGCGTIYRGDEIGSRAEYMKRRRAAYAQNVQDVQKRLERERQDRETDERVRRLGGSVNLRRH